MLSRGREWGELRVVSTTHKREASAALREGGKVHHLAGAVHNNWRRRPSSNESHRAHSVAVVRWLEGSREAAPRKAHAR